MLDNAGGSRAFSAASSDSVTSVTCAQCEPALVGEESTAPQANLAFSGKCQSGCVEQGMKHVHEYPAGGPFEGLKHSSSCSSSCSSCPRDQIAVLQASLLLLAYWPAFWCLFPTTNPLATANIDGGGVLPVQPLWAAAAAVRALLKTQKYEEREMVCLHHLQNPFSLG